jgi:hypothetical protein
MGSTGAKVVARCLDGSLIKGYTFDFRPLQARFHVFPDASAGASPTRVLVRDLKALFFVRDHAGNGGYQERRHFRRGEHMGGRRVEVTFTDGEVMVGVAEEMGPGTTGFFLVPVDPGSNNLRVYVPSRAVRSVVPLPEGVTARLPRPPTAAARPMTLPRRVLGWLGG